MNGNTAPTISVAPADHRIVGWLVSYGLEPRGASFELRSGRLLITRTNGSKRDTVTIADPALSSPHAAILADGGQRTLTIQDIFSESGTFITRSGSSEEVRVSGPMELRHGDWIRIGTTVRLQVCLIHGSGR